jgi:hypothetical protein
MILIPLFFGTRSQGQENPGTTSQVDRKPAVAGQFYSASPVQLSADLSDLFARALPGEGRDIAAIISPHAGYIFSGEVAASGFNQINSTQNIDNVFILASSHRMAFDGASVYTAGDYLTPLGKVKVNLDLASELVRNNAVFNNKVEPHIYEHSLEVQLPFLQYRLGSDFRIVPIIVGTQSAATCKKIGAALKPYFGGNNLFVISTDFSHYPTYEDANVVDHLTAEAIVSNQPEVLLDALEVNDEKDIPNLATSLCGWTSVISLLYMTEGRNDLQFRTLKYMNSGDSELYGDKDRVVGYFSIVVEHSVDTGFSLEEREKQTLLRIARSAVCETAGIKGLPLEDPAGFSERLQEPLGCFVTLKIDGALRGCIGRFESAGPLYELVREMAIAAASQDYRFRPVDAAEVPKIEIEISVLSPMKKISSIDEIELGRHGIYLKKGYNSGTFLPQVATETGWTREEFLGHCAKDKARIGWDGWKDAEIYTYEAYVFGEHDNP